MKDGTEDRMGKDWLYHFTAQKDFVEFHLLDAWMHGCMDAWMHGCME